MGLKPMHHYRLHNDPRSSHQQIAKIVRDLNRGPILDVGAAQGMLGQLLQGSNLEIDAVEPNPQWADAARPNYRNVYVGTIESVALPPEPYRVIVFADVLEHVVDPVAVLKQLRPHSAPDTVYIISVPNIAHLAVRTMLLFGFFPRMPRGILDRTHLHFFTRKTASDMLRDAGLQIDRIRATGLPLEEICKHNGPLIDAARFAQHTMVSTLPKLFGFQWIFVAHPA
jgi:2-polyprenyl-3-methyl-5-hydroxy-6-metoxy-1,4-benzoquinol methylase